MAGAAGLYSQIGFVAETTYGSAVTVTRFLEMQDESIQLDSPRVESPGLRASQKVLRYDRFFVNTKGAAGDVNWPVANKGFGLLFKHMMGTSTITTHAGGTNAKDHVYVQASMYGSLSLTVQVGRPSLSGTVQPFTYTGCKITDWELTNDVDGYLMLKTSFDAQAETTGTALATASYPTAMELFNWTEGAVTLAGSSFPIRNLSISVSNSLKTDRYFLQGSRLKAEPLQNDMSPITGSFEADFTDLTQYARFTAGSTAALVATWTTQSFIEGTTPSSLSVNLACVRFDGETPNVSGADLLNQPISFKALDDGSNQPITITYVSADAAD